MKTLVCPKGFLLCLLCFTPTLSLSQSAADLWIMSYNVHNLFDADHDIEDGIDKSDMDFLPLGKNRNEICERYYAAERNQNQTPSQEARMVARCKSGYNWTNQKVEQKIDRLRLAIEGFAKDEVKPLPDVLALMEVENESVLKRLIEQISPYEGYYKYTITKENPDLRGIDLALLYHESATGPLVEEKEFIVPGLDSHPTRPIFRNKFILQNGDNLYILVNHWPSQGGPSTARDKAAIVLMNAVSSLLNKPNNHVIALGDFNTIPTDRPDPFLRLAGCHYGFYKEPQKDPSYNYTDPCEKLEPRNRLYDLHSTFMGSPKISRSQKSEMAPGTYFYPPNMAWNLLDRMWLSKSLLDKSGPEIDIKSYKIHSKLPLISDDKSKSFIERRNQMFLQREMQGEPNTNNFSYLFPVFNKSYFDGSQIKRTSFEVSFRGSERYLYGSKVIGTPLSYNHGHLPKESPGFSDHFAISVKLRNIN